MKRSLGTTTDQETCRTASVSPNHIAQTYKQTSKACNFLIYTVSSLLVSKLLQSSSYLVLIFYIFLFPVPIIYRMRVTATSLPDGIIVAFDHPYTTSQYSLFTLKDILICSSAPPLALVSNFFVHISPSLWYFWHFIIPLEFICVSLSHFCMTYIYLLYVTFLYDIHLFVCHISVWHTFICMSHFCMTFIYLYVTLQSHLVYLLFSKFISYFLSLSLIF